MCISWPKKQVRLLGRESKVIHLQLGHLETIFDTFWRSLTKVAPLIWTKTCNEMAQPINQFVFPCLPWAIDLLDGDEPTELPVNAEAQCGQSLILCAAAPGRSTVKHEPPQLATLVMSGSNLKACKAWENQSFGHTHCSSSHRVILDRSQTKCRKAYSLIHRLSIIYTLWPTRTAEHHWGRGDNSCCWSQDVII
jgi:hypothetical protein